MAARPPEASSFFSISSSHTCCTYLGSPALVAVFLGEALRLGAGGAGAGAGAPARVSRLRRTLDATFFSIAEVRVTMTKRR